MWKWDIYGHIIYHLTAKKRFQGESLKVLDAVFLGSLLRRDSKHAANLEFLLRLQAWRSCTSHYFLVILCLYCTCWIKEA